jgi:hypothetical protein
MSPQFFVDQSIQNREMGSEKKRRKRQNDDELPETTGVDVEKTDDDVHSSGKKVKKRKGDGNTPKEKKSKKAQKSTEQDLSPPVKTVHLDSLQSIFETKSQEDGAFTLFGGEPVPEIYPEPLPPVQPRHLPEPSASSIDTQRKASYFFPHYESPEKNALSLFPELEESFYYNRSEYARSLSV